MIYARMKPTRKPSGYHTLIGETGIKFKFPKDKVMKIINNTKSDYEFKFNGIIDMKAEQEEASAAAAAGGAARGGGGRGEGRGQAVPSSRQCRQCRQCR